MEMLKVWTVTTELCEIIIRQDQSLVHANESIDAQIPTSRSAMVSKK
jgi:glutathionylspermidine synthase